MPAEELIDNYVDRGKFRSDTDFVLSNLKEVLDAYKKLSGTKVNLSGATSTKDVLNTTKQLNSEVAKGAKLSEAAAKAALLEAKAKKELALAQKAEAQARKENAAAAQKEQQSSSTSSKQRDKEKFDVNEIGRAYKEYSKAARDAALRAKDFALTLGENDPRTLAAIKNAKEMNDILKRIDASVGQYGRNVGNYKSAFDGLGMSFTQVARELPSLTISVQQFALAISNNLPMVADQIKIAKEEIAALRAEGQATPSLFQRIAGSIISFQVGLSVGIALLTAYAGKISAWVSSIFDANAAAKEAAKRQIELNEAVEKGIDLRDKYDDTTKRNSGTINRNLENQIAYAKAAGKSETEILKLERQLLEQRRSFADVNFNATKGEIGLAELGNDLNKARNEYEEFLRTGIAFGKGLKRGSEEYKERETQLKQTFDFQAKLFNRQKEIVEEYYDANRDAQIKDIELQKALSEERASFFGAELQYRADILKEFSTLEDAGEKTRLDLRKQALLNERAILKGNFGDEIRDAKGNQVKIFEATREYNFQRKRLNEEYERDVFLIRQGAIAKRREQEQADNEQFKADQEERLRIQEENERKAFETRKNYLEESRDYLLKALEVERNAKISTASGDKERQRLEEDYNNRRKKIELDTNAAILLSALEVAQAKLKIAREGTDKNLIADLEAQVAALKLQLEKLKGTSIDIDIAEGKRKLEGLKDVIVEVGGKLNDIFGTIGSLVQANIEAQKNAIQEQIDLIEERKEKEIEAVNASALNQQEKAEQIAAINARAAAQKEAQERKARALDLQRARFDRGKAILDIISRTAVAVLDGLIKGGPALAFAYGAIGAAQLAITLATPLPKFKHGRQDGPATWAITGDGGKQEVVTSPDLKQAMLTPATDTLTYLPEGWKVFPDMQSFQNAAVNMSHTKVKSLPSINSNDMMGPIMMRGIAGIKSAVMAKQETHFHWHNGELHKAIKNGINWTRYIQNNV